jgi:hypothetical protein
VTSGTTGEVAAAAPFEVNQPGERDMRLAYAPDASGRLEPKFVSDLASRTFTRIPLQPLAPDADIDDVWVDREEHHERALEDAEPQARRAGRDARRGALVVDEDPTMRIVFRRLLEAEGYHVTTCPGPGATHCAAALEGASCPRCPRVDEDTALVVLDGAARRTRLPEAYEAWLPGARIDHAVS